jgi:HTH-type transcriptional regulator / antitoxin HigA
MIQNERQYRITLGHQEKFSQSLALLEQRKDQLEDLDYLLQKSALVSQLEAFAEELQRFADLQAGKISFPHLLSPELLPLVLIEMRIAAGLTQEMLAQQVGIHPDVLQRYEAHEYQSTSFSRVLEIYQILKKQLARAA